MTAPDKRALLIGFLLLLLLTACGAAAGQNEQGATGTRATPSPSPSAMTPIIVSNKPQGTPTAAAPTVAASNATPSPGATPTPAGMSPTPPTPTPTPVNTNTPPTPTPTPVSANPTPTPAGSQSQLAQYVFGLINQDRAAKGLAPYAWSNALASGAHLHNLKMIAYGKLSHQCPGEADLGTRITNDGLKWRAAGENIGWSSDPNSQAALLSIHKSMMAEQPPNDGHRQNILSPTFTLVGVDVVVDAQQQVWLTEDFALI